MRQKARKALLISAMLLFPITMWYFSPYLIIQAASEHTVNGSFIVFVSMFILSIFFGRVWCGYLCPAGGIQECVSMCNDKPAKGGWRYKIKYVIWVLWITGIIVTFILSKGDISIDPFYMTDHGISISQIGAYIVYYGVMLLLVIPSMVHGKRATCHYFCWMAPFMVIGSTIGRVLHIPQIHIEAEKDKCISCGRCTYPVPWDLMLRRWYRKAKAIPVPNAYSAARVSTSALRMHLSIR